MIVKNVLIENFFCYVGENSLDFEEGLNIISARNSGGKSHLFNAFHWTFFNSVYVDRDGDTSKKEWKSADRVITLPDQVVWKAESDSVLCTRVRISLSAEFHENEEALGEFVDYHFEKLVKYKKKGADVFFLSPPELQIWYSRHGETKYLELGEHAWFLDSIFPKSIRKFMWFQGETVDELYDFANPSTLNYAIKEISYYPLYETLAQVAKSSEYSIEKKIDAELKKRKKYTKEQEDLSRQIENLKNSLRDIDETIIVHRHEILNLNEAISNEEDKLKGYDKYSTLKTELTRVEYNVKVVNDKIDSLSATGRRNFVSKWMLNRCDTLIQLAGNNLNLLSSEVKSFQKSDNPVPITLPGPEYIEKMLHDHICYICEREVHEGSEAYEALKARMADFRANQLQKILSDNLTDLNRFRRVALQELPLIADEVATSDAEIEKLITQRKKLHEQRENLYKDFGISSEKEIQLGSTTADQILSKIRSLNSSKSNYQRRLDSSLEKKNNIEISLASLMQRKTREIPSDESDNITEVVAKRYIEIISEAVNSLKKAAFDKLIQEITQESNRLYTKYLGGRTQGEIEIDRGVMVVDRETRKQLTNLNTAELTAQKLAVANSFLSLSERKLNRSFPLLADAPTSEFDDRNTMFLTENLADSFRQIIIMSKDYFSLAKMDKEVFLSNPRVSTYYELDNNWIDKDGIDSRVNRKTYIKRLK